MVNTYLAELAAMGKSPNSIDTKKIQLTKFFNWLKENGQEDDPLSVTSIDVVEYRQQLQDSGAKPNTVNTALSAIQSYYKWLYEKGWIDHNPIARVKRVEMVESAPRWLDKNEKYRVIRAALKEKNKRNTAMVLTMLQAGLRVSELVELMPEDVVISDRSGSITVRAGKGNKYRVVPIPKDLRDCLGEYLVTKQAMGQWLFSGQRDPKMTPRAVQKMMDSIGVKAKVEGLTPHVLRHTYGHDLIEAGTSIDRVAKLMGHSKLETTAIYTRPSHKELQNEVEKLSFT